MNPLLKSRISTKSPSLNIVMSIRIDEETRDQFDELATEMKVTPALLAREALRIGIEALQNGNKI